MKKATNHLANSILCIPLDKDNFIIETNTSSTHIAAILWIRNSIVKTEEITADVLTAEKEAEVKAQIERENRRNAIEKSKTIIENNMEKTANSINSISAEAASTFSVSLYKWPKRKRSKRQQQH